LEPIVKGPSGTRAIAFDELRLEVAI